MHMIAHLAAFMANMRSTKKRWRWKWEDDVQWAMTLQVINKEWNENRRSLQLSWYAARARYTWFRFVLPVARDKEPFIIYDAISPLYMPARVMPPVAVSQIWIGPLVGADYLGAAETE